MLILVHETVMLSISTEFELTMSPSVDHQYDRVYRRVTTIVRCSYYCIQPQYEGRCIGFTYNIQTGTCSLISGCCTEHIDLVEYRQGEQTHILIPVIDPTIARGKLSPYGILLSWHEFV